MKRWEPLKIKIRRKSIQGAVSHLPPKLNWQAGDNFQRGVYQRLKGTSTKQEMERSVTDGHEDDQSTIQRRKRRVVEEGDECREHSARRRTLKWANRYVPLAHLWDHSAGHLIKFCLCLRFQTTLKIIFMNSPWWTDGTCVAVHFNIVLLAEHCLGFHSLGVHQPFQQLHWPYTFLYRWVDDKEF